MLILQEKTDDNFKHVNGAYYTPKATLKSKHGCIMHIYIDKCCYCLAVKSTSTSFTTATHIPWEAHEVLKTLPSMKNNALISASITKRI